MHPLSLVQHQPNTVSARVVANPRLETREAVAVVADSRGAAAEEAVETNDRVLNLTKKLSVYDALPE
jgi:hypothetical protein